MLFSPHFSVFQLSELIASLRCSPHVGLSLWSGFALLNSPGRTRMPFTNCCSGSMKLTEVRGAVEPYGVETENLERMSTATGKNVRLSG